MKYNFLRTAIFFIILSFFLVSPALCALSASIELSEEKYSPGEELSALLSLSSDDYGNGLPVTVSYSIERVGAKSPMIEKTQTVSLERERVVVLKEELTEDFLDGEYIFRAEVESMGNMTPLEKKFTIGRPSGNSNTLIAVAGVLAILTIVLFLKKR
jgi:hypothetical protein